MFEDPNALKGWIADTRKKFEYFGSAVTHLSMALKQIERLLRENDRLRGSLQELLNDLQSAPEQISYDRDTLARWINYVLDSKEPSG
jgi:ABC-type transporter Mla subunit MlaD